MTEPLNGWHVTRRGFHFLYRDDLCIAELSKPADSDGVVRRTWADELETSVSYCGHALVTWSSLDRFTAEADAKYGRGK